MTSFSNNRIWHSLMLCFIRSSRERAEYLRKKHIFGSIGENCTIMDRKVQLYSNLIKMGNNVHIASKVSFVTHDALHLLLNNLGIKDSGGRPFVFPEKIGCIEIGDNVFVGSSSTILYDVKIGSNVVIGAGSIVTRDVPDNSVVAGVPASIISSFDEFVKKRVVQESYPKEYKPINHIITKSLENWLWNKFEEKHSKIDGK